jgi:hypothetical protein
MALEQVGRRIYLNPTDQFPSGIISAKAKIRMTKADAAWLAALVDGEGSITISRLAYQKRGYVCQSFQAKIQVVNTCKPLLDEAKRIAGVGTLSLSSRATLIRRPVWRWTASNRCAMAVLRAILPRLIAKRRQAQCALALQALQRPGRCRYRTRLTSQKERLMLQMRELNAVAAA